MGKRRRKKSVLRNKRNAGTIIVATDQTRSCRIDETGKMGTHTLPAGIFDELVVNDDREPKNILTDGRSNYWLIDHNHAFGSDQWTPEWLRDNAFPDFSNNLLEVLSKMKPGQRIKFGKEAPACWLPCQPIEKATFPRGQQ